MRKRTPAALANKILRHPERLLLDVPQFIRSLSQEQKYRFLLDTEAELGRIGKLQMRRQFITSFAEVVRAPSKESGKGFTYFLFDVAPQEFRDTLKCGGICEGAIQFLKLIRELTDSLETRQHPELKAQKSLGSIETSRQVDKDVIKQWYRLFRALCRIVAPKPTKKKSKGSSGRKKGPKIVIKPPSANEPIPHALNKPEEMYYLVFFQKVAREVYVECLEAFYNIRIQ